MSSISKTLVLAPFTYHIHHPTPFSSRRFLSSFLRSTHHAQLRIAASSGRFYSCINDGAAALPIEDVDLILEAPTDTCKDTVEEILSKNTNRKDAISKLMKMERNSGFVSGKDRWFPYLDKFIAGNGVELSSNEVLEALGPCIMDSRKERFRTAVQNRSYSVCLVVEGLSDFGNVSAAFRSADALGFQSVHVVSCDSSKRAVFYHSNNEDGSYRVMGSGIIVVKALDDVKVKMDCLDSLATSVHGRYRDNRHVSMGAEKWLDIELWDSTRMCFEALKSRGYRIATTHVGIDAVSIYDMDWTHPTAIVLGNESQGISDEALQLSDLHCSIPMKGMVDSFNVSVAAGILMHSAVCDRISSLGSHGDLTSEEKQILLAEFYLRHSRNTLSIVDEYAKRKIAIPT